MRKILYLLIIPIIFSSCKEEKTPYNDLVGHWMNKEFYDDVIAKKNITEITAPKTEIYIRENDSNFSFITLGQKTKKRPFIVYKKNHLVSKDFFTAKRNAELIFKNNTLELLDPFIGEKTVFVKVDPSLFNPEEVSTFQTFSIPLIHKQYISGKYQMDTSTVILRDGGKITGLGDIKNYSLCYDKSCMNGSNNTLFLSNKNFEGNFFEYEVKADSLIIYDIDYNVVARGFKSGRMGIKFAMKKIN